MGFEQLEFYCSDRGKWTFLLLSSVSWTSNLERINNENDERQSSTDRELVSDDERRKKDCDFQSVRHDIIGKAK